MAKDDEIKFRCEPALKRQVKAAAKRANRSMSNFLTDIIIGHIEDEERRLKLQKKPQKHGKNPPIEKPVKLYHAGN